MAPDLTWSPYCGAEFPLFKTSGRPVICDRNEHGDDTRHRDSETGFEWW